MHYFYPNRHRRNWTTGASALTGHCFGNCVVCKYIVSFTFVSGQFRSFATMIIQTEQPTRPVTPTFDDFNAQMDYLANTEVKVMRLDEAAKAVRREQET